MKTFKLSVGSAFWNCSISPFDWVRPYFHRDTWTCEWWYHVGPIRLWRYYG